MQITKQKKFNSVVNALEASPNNKFLLVGLREMYL